MERRRSERIKLWERVNLQSRRTGPTAATLHDISLGGIFIDTGSLYLPLNTPVAVSFSLPRGVARYGFRMETVVVRRGPTGAGLMFLRMETSAIRALDDVLSYALLSNEYMTV